MIQKLNYTIIILLLAFTQTFAQIGGREEFGGRRPGGMPGGRSGPGGMPENLEEGMEEEDDVSIPSIIHNWRLSDYGAKLIKSELDTALNFFQDYLPFNKVSFTNTFLGALGGAYQSNDFFNRKRNSDFYFYQSFDAYSLFPSQIQYFNTTTPYSLLDYSQSEHKENQNETRFNVFHSQNVNRDLNFSFFYNQARNKGFYDEDKDENKYHNIGFLGSYRSDQWSVHGNIIFNRILTEEDGGINPEQDLNAELDGFNLNLTDAGSEISNNTFFINTEYRLGKYVEEVNDTIEIIQEKFIPRSSFIYELEYSGNERSFYKKDVTDGYFKNNYLNGELTADHTKYNRLTNIFQLKFHEAPDRKYTFGKRVYIGHDQLLYEYPVLNATANEVVIKVDDKYSIDNGPFIIQGYRWDIVPGIDYSYKRKQSNTYFGGGIFRDNGKFWQWNATGKMYFAGYKSGQTELEGYINKPLVIGTDTTSLRIEGCLKTMVPDYFEQNYYSNHFKWKNNFNNVKEMTLKGKIHSKKYKATAGMNYSLISNYIYNDKDALPAQASGEMLVMSAYLDKDFESNHWMIRARAIWQSTNAGQYLHLPDLAAYLSVNYKTILSKVMHVRIGFDTRYNTSFYADAYEISTGRFYLQNEQKIGNYPFVDFHINLKLKRTRAFFNFMNVTSGLLDGNYWVAPSYPLFRRTYRIGIAWSFYN